MTGVPGAELPLDLVRLGPGDAGELLTLQRAAYVTEAQLYGEPGLPPLIQTLPELHEELQHPAGTALGARCAGRLVGAVRWRVDGARADLGRLAVVPDLQGRGIGTRLLREAERQLQEMVREVWLFTGSASAVNLQLYEREGYQRQFETRLGAVKLINLRKLLRQA